MPGRLGLDKDARNRWPVQNRAQTLTVTTSLIGNTIQICSLHYDHFLNNLIQTYSLSWLWQVWKKCANFNSMNLTIWFKYILHTLCMEKKSTNFNSTSLTGKPVQIHLNYSMQRRYTSWQYQPCAWPDSSIPTSVWPVWNWKERHFYSISLTSNPVQTSVGWRNRRSKNVWGNWCWQSLTYYAGRYSQRKLTCNLRTGGPRVAATIVGVAQTHVGTGLPIALVTFGKIKHN